MARAYILSSAEPRSPVARHTRRGSKTAGHADHLDFAAPGADMAAAGKGGGYVTVRGTSFASPLAAARLAVLLERGGSVDEAEAALAREGRPGRGYGRALVAEAFRTPPARVRATSELHPD